MKKLPAAFHGIVLPFFLSLVMTAIVSLISTVHALGWSGIVHTWVESWLWSWMIAFPTLIVILPFVRKCVKCIVDEPAG